MLKKQCGVSCKNHHIVLNLNTDTAIFVLVSFKTARVHNYYKIQWQTHILIPLEIQNHKPCFVLFVLIHFIEWVTFTERRLIYFMN